MMRFAVDENFDGRVLKGILARLPDVDIIRIQDEIIIGAGKPEDFQNIIRYVPMG